MGDAFETNTETLGVIESEHSKEMHVAVLVAAVGKAL